VVRLQAFRGLVPNADHRERSIDGAATGSQRLARRRRHPHNVAWLEAGDGIPPIDVDNWLRSGVLLEDDRPRLRWVEQRLPDGHHVAGLLGTVDLRDLVAHEQVDPAALRRRIERDRRQTTDVRPVLAVLGDDSPVLVELRERLGHVRPEMEFKDDDGIEHRVTTLGDVDAVLATDAVAGMAALLADGHHRVAAALASGRRRLPTFLALSSTAPRLLPVWRIVVSDSRPDMLRAHLAAAGDPTGEITAHWLRQRTRRPAVDDLPVVAAERFARSIPGLVRMTSSADPSVAAIAERDGAVVIGAPAPSVREVLERATGGGPLPAKSTAFHPKPRVGLVLARSRTTAD
jgi:hypothetical protein